VNVVTSDQSIKFLLREHQIPYNLEEQGRNSSRFPTIGKDFDNGQWFVVSYDSANKQEHYKKPLHSANQPS